jgi:2-keto-3-deoxy-L-rhamnonate aldolase RhmA
MFTPPSLPPHWENPIKRLLREGRPALGATLCVNSVEVAAHTAALGFDFLWIEMEHSPISLETVRGIVLATRGLPAVPFARVPVNERWMAKRVLDAGVLGVMFPFTSTPELAQQAVAACRYPPAGGRGSGAGLATFSWPAPEGYYDFADRNVMVIAIIEEVSAVERIEAIAAVPGVDVLFVGPSDLSFSMGLRGQMDHPRVTEAMEKVVAAARRHGKAPGRLATTPEEIRRALDQGFLFLQGGTELNLMSEGARSVLGAVGKTDLVAARGPVY